MNSVHIARFRTGHRLSSIGSSCSCPGLLGRFNDTRRVQKTGEDQICLLLRLSGSYNFGGVRARNVSALPRRHRPVSKSSAKSTTSSARLTIQRCGGERSLTASMIVCIPPSRNSDRYRSRGQWHPLSNLALGDPAHQPVKLLPAYGVPHRPPVGTPGVVQGEGLLEDSLSGGRVHPVPLLDCRLTGQDREELLL